MGIAHTTSYLTNEIRAIEKGERNDLQSQPGLYLDDQAVIRCRGRLIYLETDAHQLRPKLLPRKNHFTELIIEYYHFKLFHSGAAHTLGQVRHEYWIPQGRKEVRSVISKCQICKIYEGGPYSMPPMASLPKKRISQNSPFSYVGLDYLRPLYVKKEKNRQKIWVCLFTCMTVRAIHLEIVSDLCAETFLMAYRRFVARRGIPKTIITDNAPQFKLAKKTIEKSWKEALKDPMIKDHVTKQGTRWSFIVELTPWMGGFYERMI